MTMVVTTQISSSRELNRTSPNNIAEQSTRYCNLEKKGGVQIARPHWYDGGTRWQRMVYGLVCRVCEWGYNRLLKSGLKPQDARGVLMCLYCNLAGMALWFPMLFRMKFRFTNKTLLTAASVIVILTNLLVGYVTFKPLLWLLCLVEGIAKIQGTFECMSNIQLWMTPKRDMAVFFPLLHIVILTGMNTQDYASAYFGMLGDWRLMHQSLMFSSQYL